MHLNQWGSFSPIFYGFSNRRKKAVMLKESIVGAQVVKSRGCCGFFLIVNSNYRMKYKDSRKARAELPCTSESLSIEAC